MAATSGKIQSIKVNKDAKDGADFGFFTILPDGETNAELFVIWFTPSEDVPPTAADWVLRNMHIAMLREAMTQKLEVTVYHEETANLYESLEVVAP